MAGKGGGGGERAAILPSIGSGEWDGDEIDEPVDRRSFESESRFRRPPRKSTENRAPDRATCLSLSISRRVESGGYKFSRIGNEILELSTPWSNGE